MKTKTFTRVAYSNGITYSTKVGKKWVKRVVKVKEEYVIPQGYAPKHQKNLLVACKLFIGMYWNDFLFEGYQAYSTNVLSKIKNEKDAKTTFKSYSHR